MWGGVGGHPWFNGVSCPRNGGTACCPASTPSRHAKKKQVFQGLAPLDSNKKQREIKKNAASKMHPRGPILVLAPWGPDRQVGGGGGLKKKKKQYANCAIILGLPSGSVLHLLD